MKCLVVGHLVRDIIVKGDAIESRIGGGAYYSAMALSRFCDVEILTSVGEDFPRGWLDEVEKRARLHITPSERSTSYHLLYRDSNSRELSLLSVAEPLSELPEGRYDIIILNPVAGEIPPETVEEARRWGRTVGADVQGFIRKPVPGNVQLTRIDAGVFRGVDVLHADVSEVGYVRGLEPGDVRVLLVSNGEEEGTVYHRGKPFAYRPVAVRTEETTGAGDVFLAAFTYFYSQCPFRQALKRAGAFTALFLERRSFDIEMEDVNELAMHIEIAPGERKGYKPPGEVEPTDDETSAC